VPQAPAAPAVAKNAPEMTTRDAPVTFSSKVNLVQVPVVVRDRQGHAVGNLTKEDFQLLDKGKAQVIARFSIEKPGSPAIPAIVATDEAALGPAAAARPIGPIPERFIAYLIDDLHLNFGDLAQARNAMEKHLAESFESTTRAAVFTTSGRTSLDFTDDREKLHETLNKIQPRPIHEQEGNTCGDYGGYVADLILKGDTRVFNAEVAETIACMSLDPSSPGTLQMAQSMVQASAQVQQSVAEQETRVTFNVLTEVVRRMSATPGSRSVVLISPGFFADINDRPDESGLIERAIRANVIINTLDARGLYALPPGGDIAQAGPRTFQASSARLAVQQEAATADSDILAELAHGTGGTLFQNDNGLKEGLKLLAAQPEFVYVLGFSPQNLKLDGLYHSLKVTLKNSKGLELQARRGYFAPKHLIDPLEEAREEIREAVFSRDEVQDIPVDLHLQFFKASDVSAKVSVLAQVDLRHIRFRKAGDRNNNTLTILSTVFDRNGNFVTGIQKVVELRLLDQTLEKLPASGVTIKTTLDVAPGSYAVRLVVRDSEGQTMAARNGVVEIP
jgi:VWFA-related protein